MMHGILNIKSLLKLVAYSDGKIDNNGGYLRTKSLSKTLRNYKIVENWRKCLKKKKLHTLSSHSYTVMGRGVFEAV
jgi:hypothetical protein